jgi:S-adenosylmethionine decarboxylase
MIVKTKRSIQWVPIKNTKYAGVHLLAEFWYPKNIEDEKEIEKILIEAAKRSGSTPLEVIAHKFKPRGITGVVLLAESHISVHSWPEINYLAIDLFTCGNKAKPMKALEYLKEQYQPGRTEIKQIIRGIINR